jgi:hypothetical protein
MRTGLSGDEAADSLLPGGVWKRLCRSAVYSRVLGVYESALLGTPHRHGLGCAELARLETSLQFFEVKGLSQIVVCTLVQEGDANFGDSEPPCPLSPPYRASNVE